MHISEGVLSPAVLAGGAALAVAGTAIGLKKLDYDRIPQVAVLTAAFFVASMVHVPIGPASVHLTLNGLMGIFLGWVAFPAILVGLILQAILFQHGGITTLGVNTVIMAFPAIVCFYAFSTPIRSQKPSVSMAGSFMCGFGAILLGVLMLAFALVFAGDHFAAVAKVAVIAYLPIMAIEGIIAALCVRFIKRVRPEILEVVYARG